MEGKKIEQVAVYGMSVAGDYVYDAETGKGKGILCNGNPIFFYACKEKRRAGCYVLSDSQSGARAEIRRMNSLFASQAAKRKEDGNGK